MKRIIIYIVLILFPRICLAQTNEDLVAYLKNEYPIKKKISFGDIYYNEKDLPILYVDDVLKKNIPDLLFYIFDVNVRGCYGFSKRQSILVSKNGKIVLSQFGLGLLANDFGLDKRFIDLFKNNESTEIGLRDEYVEHIAKLLYSTYYNPPYTIKTLTDSISFDTKENSSLIFIIEKQRLKDINFKRR